MAAARERRLSDVEVTPERVSLRVDGEPMEAIRVKMGTNHVWRIKFPDERLSAQTFANADRAVRWMAAGMPVEADQDRESPKPDRVLRSRTLRPPGKRDGFEPQPDEEPDPEWLPLDWVPRRRYVPPPTDTNWTRIDRGQPAEKPPVGALAAVPGAPTLLDPAAMVRAHAAGAPRAAGVTGTAPATGRPDAANPGPKQSDAAAGRQR